MRVEANGTKPDGDPEVPREWTEEQLRYRVLATVYAQAGARCEHEVSGTTIGTELGLRYEDLYRLLHFLEYNGYLDYRDSGPLVCITRKGIEYISDVARCRRSIRSSGLCLKFAAQD